MKKFFLVFGILSVSLSSYSYADDVKDGVHVNTGIDHKAYLNKFDSQNSDFNKDKYSHPWFDKTEHNMESFGHKTGQFTKSSYKEVGKKGHQAYDGMKDFFTHK